MKLTFKKGYKCHTVRISYSHRCRSIVIRICSHKKLHLDDFVLLFVCLPFIASQTIFYILEIRDLYWLIDISYNIKNSQTLAIIIGDPGTFNSWFLIVQQTDTASDTLNWTSIFAVKICFLLFFYSFISQHRKWLLAWRVIFEITILTGAFCISSSFIACSHFGQTACKFSFASPHPTHIIPSLIKKLQLPN